MRIRTTYTTLYIQRIMWLERMHYAITRLDNSFEPNFNEILMLETPILGHHRYVEHMYGIRTTPHCRSPIDSATEQT